ncbi:ion transporter [Chloroflexota bacterium]
MQDTEKAPENEYHRRLGDKIIHINRKSHRRKLRIVPRIPGIFRFLLDIIHDTPLLPLLFVLTVLWLVFSLAIYLAEGPVNEQFHSYWYTLWWSFTAMQTQGANSPGPVHPLGMIIGGIWSIIGTIIFFGVIIATVYSYYMVHRNQRHSQAIVDAIEYNLNEIDHLSIEELTALKNTVVSMVDSRISNIEKNSQNDPSK